MDREIVDVIDNAGTDAGWQRGIAVGWKVADIQADAGPADRALGERETANRCGRRCQATLPRIRSGGPTPILWTLKYGLDRSEMFRPRGQPSRGTSLPVRRTCRESLYLLGDGCLWQTRRSGDGPGFAPL